MTRWAVETASGEHLVVEAPVCKIVDEYVILQTEEEKACAVLHRPVKVQPMGGRDEEG